MAKQLTAVTTDTAISGVTTNPINLGLVNFGADFVEKTEPKKGEVLITNTTAPVGFPETFRFSSSIVEDIYKGSNIDPSVRAVSKKGISLYVQHIFHWKETDTTDATYIAYYPVKFSLSMTFPLNETLTNVLVEGGFRRFAAAMYGTGVSTAVRLGQWLRGILKPSDVS